MADINTNLTILVNSYEEIKAAIQYCGGTISDTDGFEDFSTAISSIITTNE